MLCINNYSQQYIDKCRSKIAKQVTAYQSLIAAARNSAAINKQQLDHAIETFEPHICSTAWFWFWTVILCTGQGQKK